MPIETKALTRPLCSRVGSLCQETPILQTRTKTFAMIPTNQQEELRVGLIASPHVSPRLILAVILVVLSSNDFGIPACVHLVQPGALSPGGALGKDLSIETIFNIIDDR